MKDGGATQRGQRDRGKRMKERIKKTKGSLKKKEYM